MSRNKTSNSKRSDSSGKLKNGMESQRKIERLPDGSYLIEDEIKIEGEGEYAFVSGAGWLLELFDLESGEFFFLRNGEEVRPRGKRFGVFYTPFSIMRSRFKNMKGSWRGIGGVEPLNKKFMTSPFIFETNFNEPLTGIAQLENFLDSVSKRQSIEMNPNASLLSLKAKKLIDDNYLIYPSISRIAARLKVTHEHLSRQFKRDFLMSPNAYLHQVRVADATFRLSKGEDIINISMDVGYNDLSRFYKQFRKTTTYSPGSCRETMKKHRQT